MSRPILTCPGMLSRISVIINIINIIIIIIIIIIYRNRHLGHRLFFQALMASANIIAIFTKPDVQHCDIASCVSLLC